MTLGTGSAAFRFNKTDVPGIVVVYYGAIADRRINMKNKLIEMHPDPATNEALLERAGEENHTIISTFLSSYTQSLPQDWLRAKIDTVETHAYKVTDDLGPILYCRTRFIFGKNKKMRNRLANIAANSVDTHTEEQLESLIQILRLGRDNPLCPGLLHTTIVEPSVQGANAPA